MALILIVDDSPTEVHVMKKALENKQRSGGWPDQGKPRDSQVKKLKTR